MKQFLKKQLDKFLALSMLKRVALVLGILFILAVSSIVLLRILVSTGALGPLPNKEELQNIDNPLASELYASDGTLIGKYYVENRSQLTQEDLNEKYVNALIATEDVRFFKHNGVDTRSLFRVFIKSIMLQRDRSGGGSTLTQQLAKNLFPRKRYKFFSTVINKFREMSIAKKIEKIYSKEEILLMYSNTVSFGERAFGLSTASRRFFDKSPSELSLEEAATLVGMLKATTYYSPRKNPERSRVRRNVVLAQMVKYNFINVLDTVGLLNQKIELNYTPISKEEELAKYFKQQIRQEFKIWNDSISESKEAKHKLAYDGLKIYTTINYDLQIAAENIMRGHMKNLQRIFEESWKGGSMFGKGTKVIDDKILSDPYYRRLRKNGMNGKEALSKFTEKSERSLWTWEGIQKKNITKIDSIKHYLSRLHTGILAVEPETGKIRTWVGGNDYGSFQYDNIKSPRQVGSLFKPIVYLTALEKEKDPCDFYKNELRNYTTYQDWTPRNADEEYGGYLSMRNALTHSVNTVSVQVLFDAGIDNVVKTAKELGVESKLSAVPSIVLGTSDVSLYDMVRSYSTLANGGVRKELKCIERIENKDGDILYDINNMPVDTTHVEIDSMHLAEINAMLERVTTHGTGRRLYANYQIPFAVRGKTGTTQNQSDGWFIGYTDELVIGSWVGTEDRRMHFRNLGTGSGGRTALPMVGALFEFAYSKQIIQAQRRSDLEFDCPDYLEEDQYAYYQSKKKREKELDNFGGWLKKILSGKDPKAKDMPKRIDPDYVKKNKEQRLKEIERDRAKWNRKLRNLKKKRRR